MEMLQEKAKKSYRNKKTDLSVCTALQPSKQTNPFFIYSSPSNKFVTQDCPVGAAETAAPPKEG